MVEVSRTYGEDVYIGKTMGAAAVKAYEEDGLKNPTAVASCMKHYLAYSASRTGKDVPRSTAGDRNAGILPAQFRAAVQAVLYHHDQFRRDQRRAGACQQIFTYGYPCKELGFQGLVVSDWEDIIAAYPS